jgi:hypothetical protein
MSFFSSFFGSSTATPEGKSAPKAPWDFDNETTKGKYAIRLLSMFPPTGLLGLNHVALGNTELALLKSGSLVLTTFLIISIKQYYPVFFMPVFRFLLPFLSLGPWYMFDFLESFNPNFNSNKGFRLPITLEAELDKYYADKYKSTWTLTTPLIAGIFASCAGFIAVILQYVPTSMISPTYKSYMTYGTGGASSALALFSGYSALTAGASTAASTAGLLAGAGVPNVAATSTVPATTTVPVITVMKPSIGGAMEGGGSELPPLSSFSKMLKSDTKKDKDESFAFLAILALVVLGGVTMNMVRPRS